MVAYDRFCLDAAPVAGLYGELMALGLLDKGARLPDMLDKFCGKGDINTAAI